MRVLDPGHSYALDHLDGAGVQRLEFVKRIGVGYPGNESKQAGTNCQEVLRALINRVLYLDNQVPCNENKIILASLREALLQFEARAIRRHGMVEILPVCSSCGHIACNHS